MKEKVVVLLHGFKKKNYVEFANFVEYANEKSKYKIMKEVDWYDNWDKKTINWRSFIKKQQEIINSYKDKEIILVGYSAGGIGALSLAAKNDNVVGVLAMYPAFYINFIGWVKVLTTNMKKWKKAKKTLGKERYKRMKELKEKGASEKYPIRLAIAINIFRKKQIPYLKKIKNKNIKIIWSKNDEITQTNKTLKLLEKNIDINNNVYTLKEEFVSHFSALDRGQIQVFNEILSFINKM